MVVELKETGDGDVDSEAETVAEIGEATVAVVESEVVRDADKGKDRDKSTERLALGRERGID